MRVFFSVYPFATKFENIRGNVDEEDDGYLKMGGGAHIGIGKMERFSCW